MQHSKLDQDKETIWSLSGMVARLTLQADYSSVQMQAYLLNSLCTALEKLRKDSAKSLVTKNILLSSFCQHPLKLCFTT